MQKHEEEPDKKNYDVCHGSVWKCIFWIIIIELLFAAPMYRFLEELEKEIFGD